MLKNELPIANNINQKTQWVNYHLMTLILSLDHASISLYSARQANNQWRSKGIVIDLSYAIILV